MPEKSQEDHEIENRIRGHIRREMAERRIGVNAANERLGLGKGTLSKILSEQRGFKAGFVLRVQRAFKVPSKLLIEEDPSQQFMRPGIPEGLDDDAPQALRAAESVEPYVARTKKPTKKPHTK